MEVTFDIVKPNLYVVGSNIYFGISPSDAIQGSRHVNETVEKYIGTLKVKESDLEAATSGGRVETTPVFNVPLANYLNALEEISGNNVRLTTSKYAKLFGLSYFVNALTIEDSQDALNWERLERDLANPDATFDEADETNLVYRIDREKTLEQMKKLHSQLDSKMPDNCAWLFISDGYAPFSNRESDLQYIGGVFFSQLKAKDKTKIDQAKSDLIERLKEVDGPYLSFDAPQLLAQMERLYADSPNLIGKYGDILTDSNWKRRFFKLDP